MIRLLVTILLILAWHFPTTFFVPAGAPNEHGWLVWPFGRASAPVLDGLQGVIAPATPTATSSPTLALAAAGIASLAFILALASLWGIVVPVAWWRPVAAIGAVASGVLFLVYLGPSAVIPLGIDAVVLWGVLVQGWSQPGIVGA